MWPCESLQGSSQVNLSGLKLKGNKYWFVYVFRNQLHPLTSQRRYRLLGKHCVFVGTQNLFFVFHRSCCLQNLSRWRYLAGQLDQLQCLYKCSNIKKHVFGWCLSFSWSRQWKSCTFGCVVRCAICIVKINFLIMSSLWWNPVTKGFIHLLTKTIVRGPINRIVIFDQ